MMDVSVVIPAHNAAETLGECLAAATTQFFSRAKNVEVILVDDGSTDATGEIGAKAGVKVIRRKNGGAAAARNTGLAAASGRWVAFTDADCMPSRRWLDWLMRAAESAGEAVIGVAGKTIGHASQSTAARFVDLMGGLDAEAYLAHPVFPFAPTANVMFRREALMEVGGFDSRFSSFEAADLCHRLSQRLGGGKLAVAYEARALVLHRHRGSWGAYWRQQRSYGRGYAQLFLKYPEELPWSMAREMAMWGRLSGMAVKALAFRGDAGLCRRGALLKQLAQRVGFVGAYWNGSERARWREEERRVMACAGVEGGGG